MWIVLLDHSGSMGDPFEQSGDPSRRTRTVDSELKLEAAKEVLREEIREFSETHPGMVLAVFAFTEEAKLVYEGPVSDLAAVDLALQALTPEDGTDIAAALDVAASFKAALTETSLTQLVLISDGKSDRVKAMAAARRCLERQLALSMLLIDPTDEGKAFARDVVRGVGGTYQPVMSRQDLRDATKRVSVTYAADLARAEHHLQAAAKEALSLQEGMADRERVKFTSAYPGRISRGLDYPLRVYLHLESQLQQVLARFETTADQFGAYPRTGDAEPGQRIPLGTRLEITPRIHHVGVNPSQQRVAWTGAVEELSFRIHYAELEPEQPPPPPCSGFIDITTCGLLLAQIPVSIQVETGEDRIEQRTREMISRVFASYSHRDEAVVRACKAAYRALGIQLFVDKDDILSGQVWRDVLRRSIADHDLFQLFWSVPAAESDEVANEWMLAKELSTSRTSNFIRPLYWTVPMPEPPAPLKDLHFAKLDLESLRLPAGEPATTPFRPTRFTGLTALLEAHFPILDTIDSGGEWVPWLQARMGETVSFLEDLVGIRYFPPVTFLVDEHTVQAARRVLTTDPLGDETDLLPAILEMLQALALGFHVGALVGPAGDRSNRAAFFEVRDRESGADYDHVVSMAEYVFSGPTRDYLAGKDVLGNARRPLEQVLQSIVNGEYEHGADELARQTLEKANAAEREALSNVVTEETLAELKSFNEPRKKSAATRLLESDLPRLADQYEVFEFFHRTTQHSLRHHRTFPDYLADVVHHWLKYVRVARTKRPNAVIHVGYAISQAAWDLLRERLRGIDLRARGTEGPWADASRVELEMSIESYERCVIELWELLLPLLASGRAGLVAKVVRSTVSTHGIYLPASASDAQAEVARTLAERGWPESATLPGQHKVLLCMNAIGRFKAKLLDVGVDESEADKLARQFCCSVLVHEHFHAAVATGLDATGRAALGTEYAERWAKALALNESLAAWCERHFFRGHPRMLELIDGYIASGTYPGWPYGGAQVIESFHAAGGTPAVRGWMRHLRDDPENAQQEFDQRALGA